MVMHQDFTRIGIFVGRYSDGRNVFVHNDRPGGRVELTDLAAFAGCRPVLLRQRPPRKHRLLVVNRALCLIGRRYDLCEFDCWQSDWLPPPGPAQALARPLDKTGAGSRAWILVGSA